MGSKSTYLANKMLDHAIGGSDYTRVATLYFALFTTAVTEVGGGTEVSGNNYARIAVTNNSTNFPASSSGSKSNAVEILFAQATPSGWGTIVAWAIFDASTSGNMLYYGDITPNKLVSATDQERFPIGGLTLSED